MPEIIIGILKAPPNCLDISGARCERRVRAFKKSLEWSKQLPPVFKWRIVLDLACTYIRRRDFETTIRLLSPIFERDDMNKELQETNETLEENKEQNDLPLRTGAYAKREFWNEKDITSADRFRAALMLAVSLRMIKRFRESAAYWEWLVARVESQRRDIFSCGMLSLTFESVGTKVSFTFSWVERTKCAVQ